MISKKKKMDQCFCLCFLVCFFLQCPISFSWKSSSLDDLGSNSLEGPLPSSLCNLKNLEYLILSNNKLNGTIPHCFGNISRRLTVLDLRKNRFHGMIPTTFPEDNSLRNIGLNGNQLEGPLPPSLINCKNLEVLDVGNNKISDEFPMWLETLPELTVLILTSNTLHGTIGNSKSKSPFLKLRILDISYNQFTGFLPEELIKNFEAMKRIDNQTLQYMGNVTYYEDSVTLMMKGLEVEITRVLTTLTTIDLSGNQFEGIIPKSIGDLKSLKVLNFSHNKFHDLIPSILGDLSELESLDLSWNQLEGRIPQELGKLNFLSSFNVSHNLLVGYIPQGGQFNTFNDSSFSGNTGLCGFPLKNCGEVKGTTQSPWIDHQTDYVGLMSGFTWQSVLLGYGFGMILGLSMGVLMFSIRKPKWLVTSIEDTCKRSKRPRNRDRSPLGWCKIN